MSSDGILEYMADSRSLVLAELERLVPKNAKYRGVLYDLVFEYPLRDAKALRPALCIATCRALGGKLESVATSATVLELYHNAFLIHDDVEDGSEKRRDRPTLHRTHGVPVAVNVGDAMLALALEPLLDNMRLLSLGKALRILEVIARMARESAEGQALELSWIRDGNWTLPDGAYLRMVHKKTSHYTFIAPVVVGGIIGGAVPEQLFQLRLFATALGAAFQIQDDILNLSGDEARVGKEIDGDLWEGKHTVILLHAVRTSPPRERARAISILAKRRPQNSGAEPRWKSMPALVDRLHRDGHLDRFAKAALRAELDRAEECSDFKTPEDVTFLRDLIRRRLSVEYARGLARRRAVRAKRSLEATLPWLPPSPHRDFLTKLSDFVVDRDH
jgi:geranylgeranyl diphosphate synthase type II